MYCYMMNYPMLVRYTGYDIIIPAAVRTLLEGDWGIYVWIRPGSRKMASR